MRRRQSARHRLHPRGGDAIGAPAHGRQARRRPRSLLPGGAGSSALRPWFRRTPPGSAGTPRGGCRTSARSARSRRLPRARRPPPVAGPRTAFPGDTRRGQPHARRPSARPRSASPTLLHADHGATGAAQTDADGAADNAGASGPGATSISLHGRQVLRSGRVGARPYTAGPRTSEPAVGAAPYRRSGQARRVYGSSQTEAPRARLAPPAAPVAPTAGLRGARPPRLRPTWGASNPCASTRSPPRATGRGRSE
jgi:hypothetical protein